MIASPRLALVALLALTLPGCIARTAASIVTAPVRIVGSGVDMMTTSQSEADEKRGRDLRKADEQRARDERKRCRPYTERRLACPPPPLAD